MPGTIYAENDEDDLFDLRDERPLSRARGRLPWLRMIALLGGLCIAGACLSCAAEATSSRRPGGREADSRHGADRAAAHLASRQPCQHRLFGLDKALAPATCEARQHSGGGREDTLVVGALGEARYARVSFSARASDTPRSFYVDIVRRAAEAGLAVERNGQTEHARDEIRRGRERCRHARRTGRAELPSVPLSR